MILRSIRECPFCQKSVEPEDFEDHLWNDHFLTMQDYYEMNSEWEQGAPLTYIDPNRYFMPDWEKTKNSYNERQTISTIKEVIMDYYGDVISDRFLQMFLVGDIYLHSTMSHTYDEFKAVLKLLDKPHRDKIWFLDWEPGYPRTICKENIDGIKVVTATDQNYTVQSNKLEVRINDWKVIKPEVVAFDYRTNSRYNILNPTSVGNIRKLRMKSMPEKCFKFFNNEGYNSYSVFRIVDLEGNPKELPALDLLVTKLILLRNKTYMKIFQEIYEKVIESVGIMSDRVFLRNTVLLNPKKQGLKTYLTWDPKDCKEDYINISIL